MSPAITLSSACLSLIIGLTLGGCSPDTIDSLETADLILTNARVIDPETRTLTQTHLVIGDGRILAWSQSVPDHINVETLDLDGRWVMPGLVDMHTHSFGNRGPMAQSDNPGTAVIAERVLQTGVTAFVDLFGDEDALFDVRDRQRSGQIGGADIYASLSCLTAPEGHCTEYGIPTRVMQTPSEARAAVLDLAARNPDVIKLVYQPSDDQPSMDLSTFQAAVETARELGIKTIVHIKTWEEVREAAEAGVTAFTHIPVGPMPEGLAEQLAETGVIAIPTLTVHVDFTRFLFGDDVLEAPLARRATTVDILESYAKPETLAQFASQEDRWRAMDQSRLESVSALYAAGVPILTGTDAGNWGVIQGFSVHREMVLLEEAGLERWDILAAATTDAGSFLGVDYGVQPGDIATLIVLNASPLEAIANSQTIEDVFLHGKRVTLSDTVTP